MSLIGNKDLARRYFEAYSQGSIDAVMEFVGEGYVLHPGGGFEPTDADGRRRDESVFFAAFSDIHVVVEDQVAEGNRVANRVTMNCVHSGKYQGVSTTGKRVVIPYIDILAFKAGKIVEEWVEYDTRNILDQIKTP